MVDGRNHDPDDIEAIPAPGDRREQLVAIVEEEIESRFHIVKREVASAISKSHGLREADVVLVSPNPITTSGKIRRSERCAINRLINRPTTRSKTSDVAPKISISRPPGSRSWLRTGDLDGFPRLNVTV